MGKEEKEERLRGKEQRFLREDLKLVRQVENLIARGREFKSVKGGGDALECYSTE